MDSHHDIWLSNDLMESSYQNKVQNNKTSKILGRKISSCHTLKIKTLNFTKSGLANKKITNKEPKSESLSHSPIRNNLKKINPTEKLNKPSISSASSPIVIQGINKEKIVKEIESKIERPKLLKSKKSGDINPQNKLMKNEIFATLDEKSTFEAKKMKARGSIDKISKKHSPILRLNDPTYSKKWGTAKINFKDKNIFKSSDEDENKNKIKKISKKKNVESVKIKNVEKKNNIKEEINQKLKKTTSAEIQSYIKEKKKKNYLEKVQKKNEENNKERERIFGLENLEKIKKLKKLKKKSKSKVGKQFLSEKQKLPKSSKPKKIKKSAELKLKSVSDKFEIGKNFLSSQKNRYYIEEKAALKIQRWYRSLKHKNQDSIQFETHEALYLSRYTITSEDASNSSSKDNFEYDDWINFNLLESKFSGTTSEFVEEFKQKFLKNAFEIRSKRNDSEEIKNTSAEVSQNFESDSESDSLDSEDSYNSTIIENNRKSESISLKKNNKVPPLSLALIRNDSESSEIQNESEPEFHMKNATLTEEYVRGLVDSIYQSEDESQHTESEEFHKKITILAKQSSEEISQDSKSSDEQSFEQINKDKIMKLSSDLKNISEQIAKKNEEHKIENKNLSASDETLKELGENSIEKEKIEEKEKNDNGKYGGIKEVNKFEENEKNSYENPNMKEIRLLSEPLKVEEKGKNERLTVVEEVKKSDLKKNPEIKNEIIKKEEGKESNEEFLTDQSSAPENKIHENQVHDSKEENKVLHVKNQEIKNVSVEKNLFNASVKSNKLINNPEKSGITAIKAEKLNQINKSEENPNAHDDKGFELSNIIPDFPKIDHSGSRVSNTEEKALSHKLFSSPFPETVPIKPKEELIDVKDPENPIQLVPLPKFPMSNSGPYNTFPEKTSKIQGSLNYTSLETNSQPEKPKLLVPTQSNSSSSLNIEEYENDSIIINHDIVIDGITSNENISFSDSESNQISSKDPASPAEYNNFLQFIQTEIKKNMPISDAKDSVKKTNFTDQNFRSESLSAIQDSIEKFSAKINPEKNLESQKPKNLIKSHLQDLIKSQESAYLKSKENILSLKEAQDTSPVKEEASEIVPKSDSSAENFFPKGNFEKNPSSLQKIEKIPSEKPILSPQQYMGFDIDELIPEILNLEISKFINSIPFKLQEKEVDANLEFILEYLEVMCHELKENEEEVLEAINTPVYQEPLSRIALLQDPSSDTLSKFPTLELILPPELCSELKVIFQSLELPSRQIYLQMIFDCVNEALNYIRPFGVIGIPDPWSVHPRILFGEAELDSVFARISTFIIKWASCRAGCFIGSDGVFDDDRIQNLREEKMSALLCMDVRDEEQNWLEYEEEETQIKILLEGEVFYLLIDEIHEILKNSS